MRIFVGVGHISHSFTFKQQGILLPSPLGEGGEASFTVFALAQWCAAEFQRAA